MHGALLAKLLLSLALLSSAYVCCVNLSHEPLFILK